MRSYLQDILFGIYFGESLLFVLFMYESRVAKRRLESKSSKLALSPNCCVREGSTLWLGV